MDNSIFAENFVRIIIMILLSACVLTLIISLISITITYRKKAGSNYSLEHSLIYLAIFGSIFVFVLISLGLLVLNQLKAIEAGNQIQTETFISLITICLSFSALVPFFVTKALTSNEVERKVEEVVQTKAREIRETIHRESRHAVSRLNSSDADLSRMIGYLLMTNRTPDYFWSISWLGRAVKARMIAAEELFNQTGRREISNLFMSHCIRFIICDLVKIYDLSKDNIQDYIKTYMETFEHSYTGDDTDFTCKCTIARVLSDYSDIFSEITPNTIFGIRQNQLGDSIIIEDIRKAIAWLCYNINLYIASNQIHFNMEAFSVLAYDHSKSNSEKDAKMNALLTFGKESNSTIKTTMSNIKKNMEGCDYLHNN
jgi:hypothetical protein